MVPTKSLRKVREKNDHIVSQFHMVDPYYRFEMPTKEWEKQVEKEFAKGVVPRFLLWLEDKDGRDFTSNAAYTISPQEKFVKIEKGFCFTRVFRQDAVENKMEKSEFGVVADGMYLYVIGQDKNLYIIPEMSKKDYYDGNKQLITFAKKKYPAIDWGLQWEFHADSYWEPKHDTILQGNNVICAGTIIFKKGKIVRITNDSGHYQPTAHHLANGIWTLIRKNGDNDTIFNQKAYVDIWAGSNKITCMLTNFLKKNPKKEAKIIIIKSIAQEKALVIEKQTDTPVLSKAKKWIQSLKDASREDVKKSLETYDKQKKIKKKNKKKIEKDETDFSLIKKSDLK
jgi:hypothetical protein